MLEVEQQPMASWFQTKGGMTLRISGGMNTDPSVNSQKAFRAALQAAKNSESIRGKEDYNDSKGEASYDLLTTAMGAVGMWLTDPSGVWLVNNGERLGNYLGTLHKDSSPIDLSRASAVVRPLEIEDRLARRGRQGNIAPNSIVLNIPNGLYPIMHEVDERILLCWGQQDSSEKPQFYSKMNEYIVKILSMRLAEVWEKQQRREESESYLTYNTAVRSVLISLAIKNASEGCID